MGGPPMGSHGACASAADWKKCGRYYNTKRWDGVAAQPKFRDSSRGCARQQSVWNFLLLQHVCVLSDHCSVCPVMHDVREPMCWLKTGVPCMCSVYVVL